MRKLIVELTGAVLLLTALPALAEEEYPVRGFPTGEDVLNRKNVRKAQPDPALDYQPNGFRADLLSKVPPVGVHPRVIMSPEDLPTIRENIKNNPVSKKAWEDILLRKIKPDDQEPTGHSWEGLYALVMEDGEYGRKAAAALVKKAEEVEKKIDEVDATHPYKDNWWVSKLRGTGISDIARGYDYSYNYLTDEERGKVRSIISKATVGRYQHGMELPRSWRTWNWPFFSQNIANAALAIEGEEGYEPRILDICQEAIPDFLTYGVSPEGYAYEATGYWGGLVWGGGGSESIIALARRQEADNVLTHPHLQKHADSLIGMQGGPNGPWFGRGDAGGGAAGFVMVNMMRTFYPDDPRWDQLWQVGFRSAHWDGSPGRFRGVDNRTGDALPFMLLFAVEPQKGDDGKPKDWWAGETPFPLTYSTGFGHLTTRSSWDPESSVHMTLAAVTEFTNSGHDGPDEGTFSVWGQGVDWSRNGDKGHKYTPWRASIAVDGKGQYYGVAPGLFLDVFDTPQATGGLVDVTYSYHWHIRNGRYNVLYSPLFDEDPTFYTNEWTRKRVKTGLREEEMDPTAFSREFWKFAGTNYGLWCGEDRHPTMRYLNTPMRRAFRSVDLVRPSTTSTGSGPAGSGQAGYPYVVVVDDIQQDDDPHLYHWAMPLAGVNEVIRKTPERDLRAVELVVRRKPRLGKGEKDPGLKRGDALLLVRVLNRNFKNFPSIRFETEGEGSRPRPGSQRIIIPSVSVAPDFKILIYPHRHGDPLPATTWNAAKTRLTVEIGEQVDTFQFAKTYVDRRPFGGVGEQTVYTVSRGGKRIQTVGAPPPLPRFSENRRDFEGELTVSFADGLPGHEIRYTLDGSEPTAKSVLYSGPFSLNRTATVKAATFAPHWQYGEPQSPVASVTYTRVQPRVPDAQPADLVPGVDLSVYELPVSVWKGAHADLESPLMPDFARETPIFVTRQKTLGLPRVQPTKDLKWMHQGFYVFETYFTAEKAGRYRFSLNSCGPTRLTVGNKTLLEVLGPYFTMLREREGEVYLAPGPHHMTIVACDPAFFASPLRKVVPFGLRVMPPDRGDWQPVAPEQLSRDRSLSFNIAANVLEAGQPLSITADLPDVEVRYTTDGDAPTPRSKKYGRALTFKRPRNLTLKALLVKDGRAVSPVIAKPLNVIARAPAIVDVPPLRDGMIRRRYLRPDAKPVYGMTIKHDTGATGGVSYEYPGGVFNLEGIEPEDTVAMDDFLPDDTGGVVRVYEAWWRVAAGGVYEFNLPFNGVNQLLVDGIPVTRNHVPDAQPMGKILLEPGWHRLTMMYEASNPGISVIGPGIDRALTAADFLRPQAFDAKPCDTGSFLLGIWAQPKAAAKDIRLTSETFGAKPEADEEHPGALRFSGDRSLVLIKKPRQTAKELTFAAWIKPDELKGLQVLVNRQKALDNPYAQRGGFTFALDRDVFHLIHYWHGRPKFGKLKAGVWQHVAMTVQVQGRNTLLEFYLDGKKVHRMMHPHAMEVPCQYLELIGQANRRKTEPKTTADLNYDQLEIINSFKGLVADVRLYDAVLPPAAIKALAGGK